MEASRSQFESSLGPTWLLPVPALPLALEPPFEPDSRELSRCEKASSVLRRWRIISE